MSFATMATCVRTKDLRTLDMAFAGSQRNRCQSTPGEHTVVWTFGDYQEGDRHHFAKEASERFGEAFYAGTDSTVSCFTFARYLAGRCQRMLSFTDCEARSWISSGQAESWESSLGLPSEYAQGSSLPDGSTLFFGVLTQHLCPHRPDPEPAADWDDAALGRAFCDPSLDGYARWRALDLLTARAPDSLSRLRNGNAITLERLPAVDIWQGASEAPRIACACSVDPRVLLEGLDHDESWFDACSDGEHAVYEMLAQMADLVARYDAGLRGELERVVGHELCKAREP